MAKTTTNSNSNYWKLHHEKQKLQLNNKASNWAHDQRMRAAHTMINASSLFTNLTNTSVTSVAGDHGDPSVHNGISPYSCSKRVSKKLIAHSSSHNQKNRWNITSPHLRFVLHFQSKAKQRWWWRWWRDYCCFLCSCCQINAYMQRMFGLLMCCTVQQHTFCCSVLITIFSSAERARNFSLSSSHSFLSLFLLIF